MSEMKTIDQRLGDIEASVEALRAAVIRMNELVAGSVVRGGLIGREPLAASLGATGGAPPAEYEHFVTGASAHDLATRLAAVEDSLARVQEREAMVAAADRISAIETQLGGDRDRVLGELVKVDKKLERLDLNQRGHDTRLSDRLATDERHSNRLSELEYEHFTWRNDVVQRLDELSGEIEAIRSQHQH